MIDRIQYRIGALNFSLIGVNSQECVREVNFPDFLSTGPAQFTYQVVKAEALHEPERRVPFLNPQSGWRLYKNRDEYEIWVNASGPLPYLAAELSHDFSSGA